nr:hypothetical protein [Tanacetum cinerariifolium]
MHEDIMAARSRDQQVDWLEDTDEEDDEQELEARYRFMAKIQEVLPADLGTDVDPLERQFAITEGQNPLIKILLLSINLFVCIILIDPHASCVAAGSTIKDNPFAQAEENPFVNVFSPKPSSEESSSEDLSSAESNQVIQHVDPILYRSFLAC